MAWRKFSEPGSRHSSLLSPESWDCAMAIPMTLRALVMWGRAAMWKAEFVD